MSATNKAPSLHHTFDIELAAAYGVHEAILIHHFQHWIRVNQKLKRNFKEGRTWSYQSRREIAAHFSYLSEKEIRGALERLIEKKVLLKGNFNKIGFDRTSWFSFCEEERFSNNPYVGPKGPMDDDKRANGLAQKGQPIPDAKTNTKPDISPPPDKSGPTEAQELASLLWERVQAVHPNHKPPNLKNWTAAIDLMIRVDGRKPDEIRQLINYCFDDDSFWVKTLQSADKLRLHYDKIFIKMRPPENNGSRKEKNRSKAHEIKSYLKNSPREWSNFIIGNEFVTHRDSKEEVTFSLDPQIFEAEITKIFNMRKT